MKRLFAKGLICPLEFILSKTRKTDTLFIMHLSTNYLFTNC